nr:hypothetical protein [Tanacetum cinerariifolium]
MDLVRRVFEMRIFAAFLLWSNRGQSNDKYSIRFVFSHFMLKKWETYYSRLESCLAYARIREKKSLLHTSKSQA